MVIFALGVRTGEQVLMVFGLVSNDKLGSQQPVCLPWKYTVLKLKGQGCQEHLGSFYVVRVIQVGE